MRLLVSAWVVAHRGRPAALALVLAAALFGVFGHVLMQPWGPGEILMLWAMTPGTVALVVATALPNRLGPLPPPCRPDRLRRARAVWAVVLVGAGTAAAVPIALSTGDPAIWWATGTLAVLTTSAAAVSAKGALLVGTAANTAAVLFGVRVRALHPLGAVLGSLPGWCWPAVAATGLAGVTAYVVRGSGGADA
ncbi:hypothetical protein [Marmoricola sp. RAF53]|uniref:hypothetical protein n=1 Tax=Marmoricola sp. RAF53 TaxID=3233059 RepID=UPI003F970DDA